MEKSGALLVRTDSMYMWLLPHARLGHCYLMQDDLQKAYSAYQHALYSLPNPKVSAHHASVNESFSYGQTGKSEIMVWDWNPLRPIRVLG
jgi:hypothetical protein